MQGIHSRDETEKDKIKTLNRKYMRLKAYSPSRGDSYSVQSLVRQFQSEASKIFEIAACRCDLTSSQYCKFETHKKVPSKEQKFLLDQRGPRIMATASTDVPMMKLLDRSQKRAERTIYLTEKEKKRKNLERSTVFTVENTSDIEAEQAQVTATPDVHGPDFAVHSRLRSKPHMQMLQQLKETAKTADRFAVSSVFAAAIASFSLEDFGIIKGGVTRNIIDPSKMQRERKKNRVETTQLQRSLEGSLLALYLDGRKNEAIYCEKEDGNSQKKIGGRRTYIPCIGTR